MDMRFDLIFTMIYTSIPTWTHSQNSLAAGAAEALISSYGTSLKWSQTKTVQISTTKIISYAMKRSILSWICWKTNWNWDNMIRISRLRESRCRTNTSVRRRAGVWESQSRIRVGKWTIWVRSFETEKL